MDLINRQQVINMLDNTMIWEDEYNYKWGYKDDVLRMIKQLPSVPDTENWIEVVKLHMETIKRLMAMVNKQQPNIVRCRDCEYYRTDSRQCRKHEDTFFEMDFCSYAKDKETK